MIDLSTRLAKIHLTGVIIVAIANFFTFIAVITPAWQVAEDKDVNRYVQSGLWLYCPGATQCWYIFSDNLINYYERVDVCRFLLIGDCRKKLLRTPYFFGWHYAVLVLTLVSIVFGTTAIVAALIGFCRRQKIRITTIIFDIAVFLSFLMLAIGLTVFAINAEMLESKYLIGVKNTFEKEYGYSFYLAGVALLLLVFGSLAGILLTTFVFFVEDSPQMPMKPAAMGSIRRSQYMTEKVMPSVRNTTGGYYSDEPLTRLHTGSRADDSSVNNQRSVTPVSLAPSAVGHYIPPQFSNGQFQPTTRHFLSY